MADNDTVLDENTNTENTTQNSEVDVSNMTQDDMVKELAEYIKSSLDILPSETGNFKNKYSDVAGKVPRIKKIFDAFTSAPTYAENLEKMKGKLEKLLGDILAEAKKNRVEGADDINLQEHLDTITENFEALLKVENNDNRTNSFKKAVKKSKVSLNVDDLEQNEIDDLVLLLDKEKKGEGASEKLLELAKKIGITSENIGAIRDSYIGEKQDTRKKALLDVLKKAGANEEAIAGLSDEAIAKLIEKIAKDSQLPSASLKEQLNALGIPDAKFDEVKALYKYSDGEKPRSGIEDLDKFLELLDPAFSLLLKSVAKVGYEGIYDAILAKYIFGNAEQGTPSMLQLWADDMEKLEKSYKFLNEEEDSDFKDKFAYNHRKAREDDVGTAFAELVIKTANKSIDEENEKIKEENEKIEAENVLITDDTPKQKTTPPKIKLLDGKNPFDLNSSTIEDAKKAVDDICRKAIRDTRPKDEKGNSIAKPTKEGKEKLEAISSMLDLWNKNGDEEFKDVFSEIVMNRLKEYLKGSEGKFTEDKSYFETEEYLKAKRIKLMQESLTGLNTGNAPANTTAASIPVPSGTNDGK